MDSSRAFPNRTTPVLNIGGEGRFDPEWIAEEGLRLGLYARLSRLTDLAALDAFEQELIDRFGDLPDAARRLMTGVRLATLARAAGVERVDAGPAAIALTMRPGRTLDVAALGLTEKDGRLLLKGDFADEDERLQRIEALLTD